MSNNSRLEESNEKERVDVLAVQQGLFETREQAKRGVMAGLVYTEKNERLDKPGEKNQRGDTVANQRQKAALCLPWWLKT